MSKPAFSIADLQSGAKKLNEVIPDEKGSNESKESKIENAEAIDNLVRLYNRSDGNLDIIFEELGGNPAKAKKPHNCPKNAEEFASKYLKGFYNLVEDDSTAAESKK